MPVSALVTAADVRAHLNLGSDTSHDAELAGFIDAAQVIIEEITGPVVSKTVTEWHDGGVWEIALRVLPVLSITSVTEYYGTTPTVLTEAADQTVATSSQFTRIDNVLTRRMAGGGVQWFQFGRNAVKVVYVAGLDTCPGNVRMAALELVRANYQGTQQGARPAFQGSPARGNTAATVNGKTYTIPLRVRELLEATERPGGFA